MKHNVGTLDRIVRVLIALGLFYVGITIPMSRTWAGLLAIIGGLLLITAISGYCLIYHLTKINSCGKCGKNNSGSHR